MRRDTEGRQAQEKIKREFEASMTKLKPLLARIEATTGSLPRLGTGCIG